MNKIRVSKVEINARMRVQPRANLSAYKYYKIINIHRTAARHLRKASIFMSVIIEMHFIRNSF